MDARYHAALEEILLPEEMSHADRFLDIMTELAYGLAGEGNAPTALDWVFARSQAAAIWRYNRETSDGKAFADSLGLQSYAMRRQTAYREQESRVKLKKIHMEDIRDARTIHAEIKQPLMGITPKIRRVK